MKNVKVVCLILTDICVRGVLLLDIHWFLEFMNYFFFINFNLMRIHWSLIVRGCKEEALTKIKCQVSWYIAFSSQNIHPLIFLDQQIHYGCMLRDTKVFVFMYLGSNWKQWSHVALDVLPMPPQSLLEFHDSPMLHVCTHNTKSNNQPNQTKNIETKP